jgi:hypothetical protein
MIITFSLLTALFGPAILLGYNQRLEEHGVEGF